MFAGAACLHRMVRDARARTAICEPVWSSHATMEVIRPAVVIFYEVALEQGLEIKTQPSNTATEALRTALWHSKSIHSKSLCSRCAVREPASQMQGD